MDDILVPRRYLVPEPQASSRRSFQYYSLGLVTLTLVFSLVLAQTGSTNSYFSDGEVSNKNDLSAGILDFTISASATDIYLGETSTQMFSTNIFPVAGSLPIKYKIISEKISGPDNLCNAIHAFATTSPLTFDGPLVLLSMNHSTSTDPWRVEFSLSGNPSVTSADTCAIDLIYRGWRDGALEFEGYRDDERISLIFHVLDPEGANLGPSSISSFTTEELKVEEPEVSAPAPEEVVEEESTEEESVEESTPPVEEIPIGETEGVQESPVETTI